MGSQDSISPKAPKAEDGYRARASRGLGIEGNGPFRPETSRRRITIPETLEIVDEEGKIVGLTSRRACHGNPCLLHRAVHVLVVNEAGQILLQKRSPHKDIQPDKWDASVGGHLHPGENYETAAAREMGEELGIVGESLFHLHDYRWRTAIESEQVRTYLCYCDGPFWPDTNEISELRFWRIDEIHLHLRDGTFTPNFEEEFIRYLRWKGE